VIAMTSDAVQETLDTLADLQLRVGVGGVGRDRILVTLLPPPAAPANREQIKQRPDDLAPERLTRYESAACHNWGAATLGRQDALTNLLAT
jgi:hypothetical protein